MITVIKTDNLPFNPRVLFVSLNENKTAFQSSLFVVAKSRSFAKEWLISRENRQIEVN